MQKFNGLYIGTVVDNNDPAQKGRLKVNVPMIYGTISNDDLPWSDPCFPYGYNDRGIFFIPEVGSLVAVMLLNGSEYRPIWMGAIFREDDNIIPQEAKDSYPNRKIIKTKVGYIMMDDENDYIEIKHRNGSSIVLSDDKDIVAHSGRDFVVLADRFVLLDPNGHENVIPLIEYKSKNEQQQMTQDELYQYNQAVENYEVQTEGNCGAQGTDQHVVGGLGGECKSQSASPMRQWGAAHRASQSDATKYSYYNSIRSLSRHTNKNTNADLRFTNTLATRIESALDEMQSNEPELYSKFVFTDGLRPMNTTGKSAKKSLHKFGGAFDFSYSSYTCEEREKVYEIFAKYGICCPLGSWAGQDEGMHMEIANGVYNA